MRSTAYTSAEGRRTLECGHKATSHLTHPSGTYAVSAHSRQAITWAGLGGYLETEIHKAVEFRKIVDCNNRLTYSETRQVSQNIPVHALLCWESTLLVVA